MPQVFYINVYVVGLLSSGGGLLAVLDGIIR